MATLVWGSTLASAFPPAPHHRFYGMIRTEFGHPIASEDAQVYFQTTDGAVLSITAGRLLEPGVNYQLDVPMDSGSTVELVNPSAMRPYAPFSMRVVIGSKVYVPLETLLEANAVIGEPGARTRMDLTLGEDADGDGLPDAWEALLLSRLDGVDDIDPDGDADGDGLSNLEEYLSGNLAYDAEHEFALDIVGVAPSGVTLQFLGVRGRSYTVLQSNDLSIWSPVEFRTTDRRGVETVRTSYTAEKTEAVEITVDEAVGEGSLGYFRLRVQ